jgi:hypothetical protein
MEFVRAVTQYYSIATKLATPNVQAALRLMKTSVFGLDQLEVLLEPVLLVRLLIFIFIKKILTFFFLAHT